METPVCQICLKNPREKVIACKTGEIDIWALCSKCSSPPGRFGDHYELPHRSIHELMLRDVRRVMKGGFFRFVGDKRVWFFHERLWSGYARCHIINMENMQKGETTYDTPVELCEPSFSNEPYEDVHSYHRKA